MVLEAPGTPLTQSELPDPDLAAGTLRLRVSACGVCRTDVHLVDGELPRPKLPVVPGHQIVGTVEAVGAGVSRDLLGRRVGVPWLAYWCGRCPQCRAGRENLCPRALFTGYTVDGGFATAVVARAMACLEIPATYSDLDAAPLLCAGLIGFRALRFTGDARRLGLYGFGASAHIVAQIALYQRRRLFAFTRAGDTAAQQFARQLGAEWAGDALEPGPEPLDAAIIFAPAGELVPAALRAVSPGGVVVCAGIHMSDIPSFPYSLLWQERVVRSVANLTHRDGAEFMEIAPRVPVRTEVHAYALSEANTALQLIRTGALQGAAVLDIRSDAR
jgi:propanol-preferring alcohol dehydrogenase